MSAVRPETLMAAIHAKCRECSGGSRLEVERCSIRDCPLWPYRDESARPKPAEARGQISMFEKVKTC